MKSLATLSKYLGCYDTWTNLKKRHQLKWTNNNTAHIINRLTDPQQSFDTMLMWLRRCVDKLPKTDSNILLYCTLTGLRPTEACESIKLIHTDLDNYLDTKQMALLHFKYPELFLRRTKKAYFSFITEEILDIAKSARYRTYNSLRMALRKHNLDTNMNNCRKIFATFLHDNGITSETIDLLQGRSPQTVFASHYYKPDLNTGSLRKTLELLRERLLGLSNPA
jgi:intergrase/recombinase